MTATEQARESLLKAGIDAIESILKARTSFAVNLANGRLERFERIGKVFELPIQVFLALRLFLELIDRSEIHLTQSFDLLSHVDQRLFPGDHVRFRSHFLIHGFQLEMSRRE